MARANADSVAIFALQERDREPGVDRDDLETGTTRGDLSIRDIEHEHSVPGVVKFAWLGTYLLLSMLLTLHGKLVLGVFPFPWLLTCLHASFSSLGTYVMMRMGYFSMSSLTPSENLAISSFSVLFTANVALSNVSLAMVSVPFYQTMRMLCPIFTILIYRSWYGRTYSTLTYLSLVPLLCGAMMVTVGRMIFTEAGTIISIAGVVLAAIKTVVTNRFMTGSLALPPIELLMRILPLAAVQAMICAAVTGELSRLRELIVSRVNLVSSAMALGCNGFLAFLLNISSFNTNKKAGSLTMTVSGNLKQCLTLLAGIFLFNISVDLVHGSGMALTILGAVIYSKAEISVTKGNLVEGINKQNRC